MKDNKGFTFVELLATIAILTVIVTLAVTTYTRIRKNSLQKDYENLVSYIETKAAAYAGDTGITTVSVEDLITEGYLQADDQTDIYDPRDNTSLNCYIIISIYEGEQYISTLQTMPMGLNESGKCNSYERTSEYDLCVVSSGGKCEKLKDDWYNPGDNEFRLGVMTKGGIQLGDDYTYNWSSRDDAHGTSSTITVSVSSIANSLYTVEIDGNGTRGEASGYVKIDKQSPGIISAEVESSGTEILGWSKEKRLKLLLSDFSGSGVKSVALINREKEDKSCKAIDDWKDVNDKDSYYITDNLEPGKYKVCVIDKVKNVFESPDIIEVTKIDTKGADKIDLKPNTTNWAQSVILTGTATDEKSGLVAYQITMNENEPVDGWKEISVTNSEVKDTLTVTSNGTYYFWVKDLLGNTSSKAYTVNNIDRNIDSIDLTKSTTNWTESLVITGTSTDNKSGIVKYQFTTSSTTPTSGWETISNQNSISPTKTITSRGTYYFWVMDAVGNIAYKSILVSNVGTLKSVTKTVSSTTSSTISDSLIISGIQALYSVKIYTGTGNVSNYSLSGSEVSFTLTGGATQTGTTTCNTTKSARSYSATQKSACTKYVCNSGGTVSGSRCVGSTNQRVTSTGTDKCACQTDLTFYCWQITPVVDSCDAGYDSKEYSCTGSPNQGDSCSTAGVESTYDFVCEGTCVWNHDYDATCTSSTPYYECSDSDDYLSGSKCYYCSSGTLNKYNLTCSTQESCDYSYWSYTIIIYYYV